MLLKELPLSLPIVCIALGIAVVMSPLSPIVETNPLANRYLTERLTEFVVIIALMGAGLKLERPIGLASWSMTWRLLGIAMPLTIVGIAFLGWSVLGLGLSSALLLGAALAPTDPVLAADVQVGPPNSRQDDEVRFALTSEAGLNDGLAFPFVYLAIALALAGSGLDWVAGWMLVAVGWKLAAGLLCGWLIGRAIGYLAFRLPNRTRLSQTKDGLVALGVTWLTYGLTELLHGYGFLAVFIAALSFRAAERRNAYHESLHAFTEQIERLFMMLILVCFGAAIAEGSIFDAISWSVVVVAVLIILVVRPLIGVLSLAGGPQSSDEKAIVAFFGIRGIGSFYYLSFALGQADLDQPRTLWATVCLVVVFSIVLHGLAVTPTMRFLDSRRRLGSGGLETTAPADADRPQQPLASSQAERERSVWNRQATKE
jgi:NhaP-type Na+/H+ or K+/H+ antiporter